MSQPEIIAISTIDPGELLLQTVKNAEHVTPELQRAIAKFIDIWSAPVMTVQPVKVDL